MNLERTQYYVMGAEEGEPQLTKRKTEYVAYRISADDKLIRILFDKFPPYSSDSIEFFEDGEHLYSPMCLSETEIVDKLTEAANSD